MKQAAELLGLDAEALVGLPDSASGNNSGNSSAEDVSKVTETEAA